MSTQSAFSALPALQGYSVQTVQPLYQPDIHHMLALQETIINNLPEENRNYIVPKTAGHFAQFTSGPYRAIGIFYKNHLVAQTLIALVQPDDPNKNLTRCEAIEPVIQQESCYGVIEGVLVHPDYRLHGLMKTMVHSAVEILQKEHDCQRIYCEIAEGNEGSVRGFIKNGFECIARGEDPTDGCKLQFMQYIEPR